MSKISTVHIFAKNWKKIATYFYKKIYIFANSFLQQFCQRILRNIFSQKYFNIFKSFSNSFSTFLFFCILQVNFRKFCKLLASTGLTFKYIYSKVQGWFLFVFSPNLGVLFIFREKNPKINGHRARCIPESRGFTYEIGTCT